MATAPSYVEQQAIPREKSLIENLMDFSFERMLTPRMLKMLYGVHLLIGLIAAIWFVFNGFQTSTANGLLALILGFGGDASLDRVLPHCRGIAGRRVPRCPGHHQFAGLSAVEYESITQRPGGSRPETCPTRFQKTPAAIRTPAHDRSTAEPRREGPCSLRSLPIIPRLLNDIRALPDRKFGPERRIPTGLREWFSGGRLQIP